MLKLSANLGFLWSELPLLERVIRAAWFGFRAVEVHWPFEVDAAALGDACEQNGLTLVSLNSEPGDHLQGDFGLAALPGREQEFAKSMVRVFDYAEGSGALAVHVLAGQKSEHQRTLETGVFISNLRLAAKNASARGLQLLLEPMNKFDRGGYLYSKAEEAVALIEAIGEHNVRLLFDAYHIGMGGLNPVEEYAHFQPYIGHIQIASVPARREPDEGTVDMMAFLRSVEQSSYDGWVGCEYRPRLTPEAGLSWTVKAGIALTPSAVVSQGSSYAQ